MKAIFTHTLTAAALLDAHQLSYNPPEKGVSLAFNLKQEHPPN